MNIPMKIDSETNEFYIDIADLEKIFDNTSEIEYYTIDETEDKVIVLEFFNKNNEKVKLNLK